MEIIILGASSDDKGTQLENLTQAILRNLGYTQVLTSEIGAGGFEVDVTAEFLQPGIGGNTKRLTICECKAHRAPISTTDWMKFLGKIFTYELGGKHVDGCFIALNGANGNVRGQYRQLSEIRQDISLVSGDDLFKILGTLYQLSPIGEVQHIIASISIRKVLTTSICYYKESVYWLISFTDNSYTLLNHAGNIINAEETDLLKELIGKNLDLAEFIDLKEDKKQRDRLLLTEKYVISMFLLEEKSMSATDLHQVCNSQIGLYPIAEFQEAEISAAVESLRYKEIIIEESESFQLKILTPNFQPLDVVYMFRTFIDEMLLPIALGSDCYKRFINAELLNEIGRIQGGLKIPEDRMPDWIRILQWSPSALHWALYPEPFIADRIQGLPDDDPVNLSYLAYFNQRLANFLSEDFLNQGLANYFYKVCGFSELETEQVIKLKNSKELLIKLDYKERIGLFSVSGTDLEQTAVVRFFADEPEPWDRPPLKTD